MKILIKKLKFFPIMGVNLTFDSEVATSLTADQLLGTLLEGENEVFIGSMNKWMLFYNGMTLCQGDIRTTECANLMKTLGAEYQIWLGWNVRIQASSFNESILILVDKITSARNAAIYI